MSVKVTCIIARLNIGGSAIQTILLTAGLDPARFESTPITRVEAVYEGNMLDFGTEGRGTAGHPSTGTGDQPPEGLGDTYQALSPFPGPASSHYAHSHSQGWHCRPPGWPPGWPRCPLSSIPLP